MTEVDVDHQINAVQRKVGTRTIDAGEATSSPSVSPTTPTRHDLWDAVTSAERIPRWFMPISGDLTVGGSYQLEGHAGGTVLTCDPPKNFTATWEFGGGISWIDVSVSTDGPDRARLVIEHIAHVGRRIWQRVRPGRGRDGLGFDAARACASTWRPANRSTRRSATVDRHRGRSSLSDAVRRGSGAPRTSHSGDGPCGGAQAGRAMHQGVPRRGVKLEHVLAIRARPEISSTRCMPRHLSRLRG